MTEQELKEQIRELKEQKIYLSALLSLEIEGYFNNNRTQSDEGLKKIKDAIAKIDSELVPLQNEYDKLFYHYYVRFTSISPDPMGNNPQPYTYHDIMKSKVECNIDTTVEKPNLQRDRKAQELLEDLIRQLADRHRDITFLIIKRMS